MKKKRSKTLTQWLTEVPGIDAVPISDDQDR
jgi:hypothetical protein